MNKKVLKQLLEGMNKAKAADGIKYVVMENDDKALALMHDMAHAYANAGMKTFPHAMALQVVVMMQAMMERCSEIEEHLQEQSEKHGVSVEHLKQEMLIAVAFGFATLMLKVGHLEPQIDMLQMLEFLSLSSRAEDLSLHKEPAQEADSETEEPKPDGGLWN